MGQFERPASASGVRTESKPERLTPFVRKLRRINIPAWAFVLFCVLFDELVLHFMVRGIKPETQPEANLVRFLVIFLFAAATGLFFGLFTIFFKKPKTCRVIAVVITSVLALVTVAEYFIYASFFNYMWLGAGAGAAKNVAENKDFVHSVVVLVLKGFWRIILFALPVVLYGIFGGKGNWGVSEGVPHKIIAVCGCLFCFCFAGLLVGASPDTRFYGESYNFSEAAKSFGLTQAVRLELFGAKQSSEIDAGSARDAQDVLQGFNVKPGSGQKTETGTGSPAETAPSSPAETAPAALETGESGTETSAAETAAPATETQSGSRGIKLPGIGDEPEETESPYGNGVHDMGIDFAMLAEKTNDSDIKSVDEYLATLTPASENEYTGLFAGKNLIFITAEAFSAELIVPEVMPTLYRLAHNGIYFTDYYQPAWGGSTSTGEFSNMTGIMPTDGVNSINKTTHNNMSMTIGNLLKSQNYFTAAYHNGEYDYYDRDETHPNLGYATFTGLGNGMENGVKKMWPESDLEMIDYTVPQFIDKQPFSVYYMTISGHCLYSRTGNNMSVRNYDDVAGKLEQYSERIKCYFAANYELEKALTRLMKYLDDAGIADDTVIVLGTDHYPYGLEKSDTWGNDQDYLAELYGYSVGNCFEQDHSALIIWSGCIEDRHIQVDDPVFSLDIVPTLANLFGVEYDSRLYAGRDVFSDDMALVFWPSGSWKTVLGRYNAANGSFKLSEYAEQQGIEITQEYLDAVRTVIANKRKFSSVVINKDYYGVLFD